MTLWKTYTCTRCERLGEHSYIVRRALLRWSKKQQDWVVGETFFDMFCANCDYEGKKHSVKEELLPNQVTP